MPWAASSQRDSCSAVGRAMSAAWAATDCAKMSSKLLPSRPRPLRLPRPLWAAMPCPTTSADARGPDRRRAVVLGLGGGAVAGIGAFEAVVLGDVRREIPERPLDGLGLSGVRGGPVDAFLPDQLRQQPQRILRLDLEAVAGGRTTRQQLGGDAAPVVDDDV